MPSIPATTIELPIPDELKATLNESFDGILEIEADVQSIEGGKMILSVTGVYPQGEPRPPDYTDLLSEEDVGEIE